MNLILNPIEFTVTTDNMACMISANTIPLSKEGVFLPELLNTSNNWGNGDCTLFRKSSNIQNMFISKKMDAKSFITINAIYLVGDQRGKGIGSAFLKKFLDNFKQDFILFTPDPAYIDGYNELYSMSVNGDDSVIYDTQKELYYNTIITYEPWLLKHGFRNVTHIVEGDEGYDGRYYYIYTNNKPGSTFYNDPEIRKNLF